MINLSPIKEEHGIENTETVSELQKPASSNITVIKAPLDTMSNRRNSLYESVST